MKEYTVTINDRTCNRTEVCNLCGKRYGGKRGMKLHFKYSHGIILTEKNFDGNDTIYTCSLCAKNLLNCICSIKKRIK